MSGDEQDILAGGEGGAIVGIDDAPVNGLANMFRRMWSLGSAGVDVPLDVLRNSERMQLKVRSGDRAASQTLKAGLERIMKDRVPGVTEVVNIGETLGEIQETSVSL